MLLEIRHIREQSLPGIKASCVSPVSPPAIDPRILVTLWVFITSEGVGSAREIEELCACDLLRWISMT